jgi:hypothetical protein
LKHHDGGFYIPVSRREFLLTHAHGAATGGHFSARATLRKLAGVAWWPDMKKDVESLVGLCGACQRNKVSRRIVGEVQPYEIAHVMERVHLDLVGPLPVTRRGNQYIMTARDSLTNYTVLTAIPDKSATSVASAMVRSVYLRLGFPQRIVTDGGKEFVNSLNASISSQLGIAHAQSSPYHPATNGEIERSHREVETILRCVTDPDQSRWDLDLPLAEWAMNSTWTRANGSTPFFLMHGRHARTVVDALVDTPVSEPTSQMSWAHKLQEARRVAAALSGMSRRITPPEKRVDAEEDRPKSLKVGDLVLVEYTGALRAGLAKKLRPLRRGPYRVVSVKPDGVSGELEHVSYPQDRIVRHVQHLTKYAGESDLGDEEWEVEAIVAEEEFDGESRFLVKWLGFGPDYNIWLSEEDLGHASLALETWRATRKNASQRSKVPVVRVIDSRQEGGETKFLVALDNDSGPEDFQWIARRDAINSQVLDDFDALGIGSDAVSGGGVGTGDDDDFVPERKVRRGAKRNSAAATRAH